MTNEIYDYKGELITPQDRFFVTEDGLVKLEDFDEYSGLTMGALLSYDEYVEYLED